MARQSPPSKRGQSVGDKALQALAQLKALGNDVVTLKLLMKMCRTDKEASFLVLMRKEKMKGLIDFDSPKSFTITAAGLEAAGPIPNPESQEDLTDLIRQIFQISGNGTPAKIFDLLLDRDSHPLSDIARECGYDPNDSKRMTSFKVMLRSLVSKDVIYAESKDMYRIADMCLFHAA